MKEINITEETKLLIPDEDTLERKQAYSRFVSVMAEIILKYHTEEIKEDNHE